MTAQGIAELWIDAEQWSAGSWVPDDDCVDVVVTLTDGSRWSATVCSFKHLNTLRKNWESSGECLSGRYLWMANLILATGTTRVEIDALLQDLISTGEFSHALAKISQEAAE